MISDLTPEAFLDALSKGKGRTALALQNSDPTLYTDALLQGCVENLQFDRQLEADRVEYVLQLLALASLTEQAREVILKTLPNTEEGWDFDWMIDLLEGLALRGDAVARRALMDLSMQGDERAQNALAIVDDEGLQWVEQNVLPNLSPDDRWRIVLWLPDEEADDKTPSQRRLRALDKQNDAEREALRLSKPHPKPTAKPFLRALRRKELPLSCRFDFQQSANVREWRIAARLFLRETDHSRAWRIARTFQRRRFPLPVKNLFRHAFHPERGGAAMEILGTFDTPAVRRFALSLLRHRPLPWNAISALTSSLRLGDEPILLKALRSTEHTSRVDRHSPILDVVHFLREHPKGRWQPHAEWIYEHSPCSLCRASAVDWMVEHGTVPAYIREEGPYDAEPDIREAVGI